MSSENAFQNVQSALHRASRTATFALAALLLCSAPGTSLLAERALAAEADSASGDSAMALADPNDPDAPHTGSNPDTNAPEDADPLTIAIEQTWDAFERAEGAVSDAGVRIADVEARIDSLQERIDANQQELARLEERIPVQRQRCAEAVRTLYKMQQDGQGVIDLILNAENLGSLLLNLQYLQNIQDHNQAEIDRLVDLQQQAQRIRESLEADQAALADEQLTAYDVQAAAQKTREEAEEALEEAQEARRKMQDDAYEKAEKVCEEVTELAEEADRKAAEEAEERKRIMEGDDEEAAEAARKEQEEIDERASRQARDDDPTPEPSGTFEVVGRDGADWSVGRDAFIETWTERIDAYLEGSPLAGQGKAFATAAWNYGVDPRWSPAISNTESSKGRYCFRNHNAWGWGQNDWDSWGEAIDAHVKGLSKGYGYTITPYLARKYCPPNWIKWYRNTCEQMEKIWVEEEGGDTEDA